MNFVREVVEANAKVTTGKLTNELPQFLEECITLKSKTLHQVDTVYSKFLLRPRPSQFLDQTQMLMEKVQKLETNLDEVMKVEINETHNQITECKQQLAQINAILQITYEFNNIYNKLRDLTTNIKSGHYLEASKILQSFEKIDPTQECNELRSKLYAQAELLGNNLNVSIEEVLEEYIQFATMQRDDIVIHTLQIQTNDNMEEAFKASSVLQCKRKNFIQVWKQIIFDMLTSIVLYATLISNEDGRFKIEVKKAHRDSYQTVFENLIAFAKYIKGALLLSLDASTSVLDLIREDLQDDITSLIIKDCLEGTIPDSEVDLEAYPEVEKQTTLLENMLKEAKLLETSSTALSDYVSEVKVHFVDKKAKKYYAMAMDMMKQDLYTIVTVGIPFNPNDLSLTGFSECAISKSTTELLSLAQSLLKKEIACSGGSSGYYVETARSILSQYDNVVEEHHQRLLQTVPRQRAIFYNNCKYIAHELRTIEWVNLMNQLPPVFVEYSGFTQVAFHLSEYANAMLEKITTDEVQKITKRIDECGIHLACDKLDEKVAQEVRQCLRQQELIKTMWHKVLNYHDYNCTIGTLLGVLSKSVTENIMKISDIPLDVCEQLIDVLKLIVTRGPKLLTDPKEINLYVMHWGKLNETMFVLNSGLEAIGERWADGKGPLALHFTPSEMRSLVRALFQNSDKRATLLAHI